VKKVCRDREANKKRKILSTKELISKDGNPSSGNQTFEQTPKGN